jgi:hypothetical protein
MYRQGLGVGTHGYRASCFVWAMWLHFFAEANRIALKSEFIVSICCLWLSRDPMVWALW